MVPWWQAYRYATGVNERNRVADRAAVAYRALADLAETVEDEWQYVNDLVDEYLPGIRVLAGAGDGALTAAQILAVDEAIAEIGLISDPHKAIDWLSTFPHLVALALGGDVDAAARASPAGTEPGQAGDSPPEPDDDSPFRILLGGDR
jgi:hypothetical protein